MEQRAMTHSPIFASKEEFLEQILRRLREDDGAVLEDFQAYQKSSVPFFDRVEVAHEFLDLLTFKIKESKSRMDKEALGQFSLDFIRDTLKSYGYNPKFVAVQCKALITYYQNQKNLDKAIEVCELLIRNGITDDDSKGFHVRLDELYRLKRKVEEKGGDLSGLQFPAVEEEEDDRATES
jgi:hypothetical protein